MNEFWAAIAGAVVGGIIAFVIQIVALRSAKKDRLDEAADKQKALGHALIFKVIRIYSHLRQFNLHLLAASKLMPNGKGLSWQIVLPIINSPDKIHFTTDEMVMLLGLKDNDLFNDLVEMDERHNATITAFEAYRDHRLALTEMLPSNINGVVGTVELTQDQLKVIGPKMVELDSLLKGAAAQSERQERDSWDVLQRLRDLLVTKVGLTLSIEAKRDHELLANMDAPGIEGIVTE